MIGRKFGRLLVVSPAKSRHKRAYWNCQCDCGTPCTAMGKYLRQHKKQSCGCLRRESSQINAKAMTESNNLPDGEAAFNLLYANYRCAAANRSLEFNLTKDDFKKLTQQSCSYCGASPNAIFGGDLPNGGYSHNGVDRVDNAIGYILENCIGCCKKCNWMKNTHSVDEFLKHCFSIVEFQNRKRQAEMTCPSNKVAIAKL